MSQLLDLLLTDEQRAEIESHERAEQARVIRGEPYTWPFPWRSDARRRDEAARKARDEWEKIK